jgi:hypothetical protein
VGGAVMALPLLVQPSIMAVFFASSLLEMMGAAVVTERSRNAGAGEVEESKGNTDQGNRQIAFSVTHALRATLLSSVLPLLYSVGISVREAILRLPWNTDASRLDSSLKTVTFVLNKI